MEINKRCCCVDAARLLSDRWNQKTGQERIVCGWLYLKPKPTPRHTSSHARGALTSDIASGLSFCHFFRTAVCRAAAMTVEFVQRTSTNFWSNLYSNWHCFTRHSGSTQFARDCQRLVAGQSQSRSRRLPRCWSKTVG